MQTCKLTDGRQGRAPQSTWNSLWIICSCRREKPETRVAWGIKLSQQQTRFSSPTPGPTCVSVGSLWHCPSMSLVNMQVLCASPHLASDCTGFCMIWNKETSAFDPAFTFLLYCLLLLISALCPLLVSQEETSLKKFTMGKSGGKERCSRNWIPLSKLNHLCFVLLAECRYINNDCWLNLINPQD